MFDLETLELFLTVLISGVANYIFIRERLLVLETKFQHTRQMVEELAATMRKVERGVLKLEGERKEG